MILKKWEDLPPWMQTPQVRQYYEILCHKKGSLAAKRVFDVLISFVLLLILSPVLLILAAVIKCDSRGPVFFRQRRVTTYGRVFRIFKFRSMVQNAESLGTQVTVKNDSRITRVGKVLRKFRLDELPQLINVFIGDMSFVGTRPEVEKYVKEYSDEMNATLLMPAGVTSLASICYKDENTLLKDKEDADAVYVSEILPGKMQYNLAYIEKFSFFGDIRLMFKTAMTVFH